MPQCRHIVGSNRYFKCGTLSIQDVKKFHDEFYRHPNKKDQDGFLLKHCSVVKTKRRRPRVGLRKPTKFTTKLYVRRRNSPKLVPVCQKTFLDILKISVHRIRAVAKVFEETGTVVQERRGGDHRSAKYAHKLVAVKTFIENFKCLESHYCRSSTIVRRYLPAELNIKKMWRMYNAQCGDKESLKVRHCYFRQVFNRRYNLGFGTPRTDTCSKCTELLENIKKCQDGQEKSRLMTEKRVHMLKAKYFYRLLKEKVDNMLTISFDCQKNQVLPKIPDQSAYYSRQLYIYNFGTVLSVPDNTLNSTNVVLYAWTEDEHRKGANEIASAVFHRLQNLEISEHVQCIRLVADGCGAQNKNTIMVGMCAFWLMNAPPQIQQIEIVFPIPGHSFLPPDRVFGNIEKEIKKMEEIIDPETYIQILKKYGSVIRLDNNVMDWKSALNDVIRPPASWHFQFAQTKRFYLKRSRNNILVRGEMHYGTEMVNYKSILKKKKAFSDIKPRPIEKNTVVVKQAKLNDVDNLLQKHFGPEWKSRNDLNYYTETLRRAETQEQNDNEEEEICRPDPQPELSL